MFYTYAHTQTHTNTHTHTHTQTHTRTTHTHTEVKRDSSEREGTLTLERNKAKAVDSMSDTSSILASLFSGEDTKTTYSAFSSDTSDLSEFTSDEPVDILALSVGKLPAAEKLPQAETPWRMEVDASGRVYYWNTVTKETSWNRPEGFLEGDLVAFLEKEKDAGKKLDQITEDISELFDNNANAYQDSHKTVALDANGNPKAQRLVYVDEVTCIGCTNCATIARNTFYMHDEHGRARAFRQGADAVAVIDEAVSTCPVDCIWYVSWEDLVILEQERNYVKINNQARLVGGSNIETTGYFGKGGWGVYANEAPPTKSKASIMNRGEMRCNDWQSILKVLFEVALCSYPTRVLTFAKFSQPGTGLLRMSPVPHRTTPNLPEEAGGEGEQEACAQGSQGQSGHRLYHASPDKRGL